MVFITAGMGGGTGTGAAPVIARAAKEQGILTVGVVTKPFHFEGQRRMMTAERGIALLSQHVDTLIVIPNQNLFRVANEKTTFAAAFAMADQVLYSGVASITELMTKEGLINLDFADVRAIMSEMGKAMMGTGEASGEKRAIEAAEAAISNPLLDDVSMRGARGLLISISGGPDLTLYEVDEAATRIREEVDPEANIILGATFDETLDGTMRVSVVATGLPVEGEEHASDDEVRQERIVVGFANPVAAKARPVAGAPAGHGRDTARSGVFASDRARHLQAFEDGFLRGPRGEAVADRMDLAGVPLEGAEELVHGFRRECENERRDVLHDDRVLGQDVLEERGRPVVAEDPHERDPFHAGALRGGKHRVADVLLDPQARGRAVRAEDDAPPGARQRDRDAEPDPVAAPVGHRDPTFRHGRPADDRPGVEDDGARRELDRGGPRPGAGRDDDDVRPLTVDERRVHGRPGHD